MAILPLLIVVGITALKDGYEDVKRHQSDSRVNQTEVRILQGGDFVNHNVTGGKSKTFVRGMVPKVLRSKPKAATSSDVTMLQHGAPPGAIDDNVESAYITDDIEFDYPLDEESRRKSMDGTRHVLGQRHHPDKHAHWKKMVWEDVKVGDFIKIVDDQPVPADIVVCATSEEENVAFVETKNLDGETNLKSRNASPALTHLRNAKACAEMSHAFRVDADRPDTNMYKLSATVTGPDGTSPVDLQETLLRGTVVRHTGWVIGLVIFTGQDTKIVLNSGGTPSKRSKVERQMNPQV